MTDHQTTMNHIDERWVAVCLCGRWRSDAYVERDDAENKALAHEIHGDNHLRAVAQFERGPQQLKSAAKYAHEQAEDPSVPEKDRKLWRRLADDLANRASVKLGPAGADDDNGQEALFDT